MGGTYRALGLCMEAIMGNTKGGGHPVQRAALDASHVV